MLNVVYIDCELKRENNFLHLFLSDKPVSFVFKNQLLLESFKEYLTFSYSNENLFPNVSLNLLDDINGIY